MIGYNAAERALEVHFQKGGVYRYHGVPQELYDGIKNADSPGRFHHAHIKGQYRHERIG